MLSLRTGRARACATALAAGAGLLFTAGHPTDAAAQATRQAADTLPPRTLRAIDGSLAALLDRAAATSPRLRAARARVDAARARVAPAGARPDPMLMAGVQNLPVTDPGFGDEMTMKMVGVSQTIPLWGKLRLARSAVEREVVAAAADVAAESLAVRTEVKNAYYDVAFADRALDVLDRSRLVLLDLVRLAEVRYGTGAGMGSSVAANTVTSAAGAAFPASSSVSSGGAERGVVFSARAASSGGASGMGAMGGASSSGAAPARDPDRGAAMPGMPADAAAMASAMPSGGMGVGGQGGLQDVVSARLAVVRLGEQAAVLREQRTAALARLNALLDQPSATPLDGAAVPEAVVRAAVAASASQVRFESAALGSRAADSPLPPLVDLQDAALAESPAMLAHEAMIAAQRTRLELARRDRRPDVDVSLEYGQRAGMPDMVSARVSIPLPINRARRQDQYVAEARAGLTALEEDHYDRVLRIRAQVAELYAALERDRAQLALYVKAVLPQGQAAVDAATASFRTGRTGLAAVLEARSALFEYETTYHRALTDFAKTLAALDAVVGREVLHD